MTTSQLTLLLKECLAHKNASVIAKQNWEDLKHTPLFGPGALLESLDFINFIVEVEEKIFHHYRKKINLRQCILENGVDILKTPDRFAGFLERKLHE